MSPRANQTEAVEESSVGSFHEVDRVEMDDSDHDEDASSSSLRSASLVNLTTDSKTAKAHNGWIWNLIGLFSILGFGMSAFLMNQLVHAREELEAIRSDSETLFAHKQIINKNAKAHNWLAGRVEKFYMKVESLEQDVAASMDVLSQETSRWEDAFLNVADELHNATSSLRELETEVAAYKSRSLGSDSLKAELDPVPQLLMRDIWSDDEREVVQAMNTLLTFARDESLVDKKLSLGFGHVNVILIMARWKDSVSIQRYGCQMLSTLPQAMLKHAASVGALDAVLLAMKRFPSDEHLQEQALYTLHHLVAKNSGNMMRLVERLTAMPIVLDAMRSFPDSAVAQFYGIRLLKVLGSKHQFVAAIIEAGGLVVLGDTYARWLYSVDELEKGVVELARTTMASLVSKAA
ncbi:hypothetical protein MPSEU_000074400 [Mayamaea pseudoterrestris]|nr:hypothetical protein MPSEU_000074400 [Mayamaea pseudoterrestris]